MSGKSYSVDNMRLSAARERAVSDFYTSFYSRKDDSKHKRFIASFVQDAESRGRGFYGVLAADSERDYGVGISNPEKLRSLSLLDTHMRRIAGKGLCLDDFFAQDSRGERAFLKAAERAEDIKTLIDFALKKGEWFTGQQLLQRSHKSSEDKPTQPVERIFFDTMAYKAIAEIDLSEGKSIHSRDLRDRTRLKDPHAEIFRRSRWKEKEIKGLLEIRRQANEACGDMMLSMQPQFFDFINVFSSVAAVGARAHVKTIAKRFDRAVGAYRQAEEIWDSLVEQKSRLDVLRAVIGLIESESLPVSTSTHRRSSLDAPAAAR